jgi:HEAT repeat protein
MRHIIPAALLCVLLVWPSGPAFGQLTDPTAGFVRALKSRDIQDRLQALQFFSNLGPSAKAVLPQLVEMLRQDEIGDVRFEVARVIGRMGPEARAALPALREALKDPDHLVHVFAAEALVKIDPATEEIAVAALVEALRFSWKEPGEVPPFFVYGALTRLGPKGRGAEAAVMEGVKDPDLMIRVQALQALEAMQSRNPALVPLLVGVLQDAHHAYWLRMAEQGGRGLLLPLLVGRFGRAEAAIWGAFNDLSDLSELNRVARRKAAGLLGELGPQAGDAIPALRALLEDRSPEVRRAARKALEKVQAER